MHPHLDKFSVIQPGAAQRCVTHIEAERRHEMQFAARICRQANHIAGIRWDFRLI